MKTANIKLRVPNTKCAMSAPCSHSNSVHAAPAFSKRMRGYAMAEYLAVLMGLMGIWVAAPQVVQWIQAHFHKLSWALMLPF